MIQPLLFNIVLEFLARAIQQEKEIEKQSNWKVRTKIIFAQWWYVFLFYETLSIPQKTVITNELNKVAGYKFNT